LSTKTDRSRNVLKERRLTFEGRCEDEILLETEPGDGIGSNYL
jgi:hypothetical protein